MTIQQPFHEGELAVQEKAGESHNAFLNSRMIAGSIMPQALPFIEKQPWVILGGTDSDGQIWCSVLLGKPGFAQVLPDGKEVHIDLSVAPLHPANPLLATLSPGHPLGALFIELATRKRFRVNGRIAAISREHLQFVVEESFPNCPKFIQRRVLEVTDAPAGIQPQARAGQGLGAAEKRLLETADTFFIASRHPERGVDSSHRGGQPGFIEVLGDALLRVPDYPGNGLFQTFGNLAVDARSGWVIPDFETGGQLQVTGHARIVWDDPDPKGRTAGTGRFLELEVSRWHWTPPVLGQPHWTFLDASPFNP